MEVTLAELLNGKATIIKNKDYLSTADYVQPFLDSMAAITNDFRVKVKLPDQMTVGQQQDTTYNRVLVEAVLPAEHCIDKHDEVIGFLYALDVRKPISKLYRGYLNRACTNLCVFDPKWLTVTEMRPGEGIKIDSKQMLELPNHFEQRMRKLKSEFISDGEVLERLGGWVDKSLREYYYNGIQSVRISPNTAVEAYKSLYIDETSTYFKKSTEEASLFDVYNAFTQIITDDTKDFINKFEKTMMVNKLLGL
jgi:hypothetical protein